MNTTRTVFVFVLLVCAIAQAATIHVPADYSGIQKAIDAAVNGDTVLVSPGSYSENLNFLGKAITVVSSDGPMTTLIDAGRPDIPKLGSGVTFESGEGPDSVLEGFTIFNGKGTYPEFQWDSCGGGVYCSNSSPTLIGNLIANNMVEWDGGGMYCLAGNPTLIDCTFSHNEAHAYYSYGDGGGGVYTEGGDPMMIDCTFEFNESYWEGGGLLNNGGAVTVTRCVLNGNEAIGGGGIYSKDGKLTVTDCTFTNNFGFLGGAMSHDLGHWFLKGCVFKENSSDSAAGIMNWAGSMTIHDCDFLGNVADSSAGGINVEEGIITLIRCRFDGNSAKQCGGIINRGDLTLINCAFTGNTAQEYSGALMNDNRVTSTMVNCTFFKNSSQDTGAVLNMRQSVATMANCIFWNDTPNEIQDATGSYSEVSYSCVKGGWPGTGNIDTNPLFVDPVGGDLHLRYTSSCRDTGDNSNVFSSTDLEGDPRVALGTVDMGADEFYTHLYVTGLLKPGGSIEAKFIGLPGSTPVGLFVGSGILPTPVSTMWGEFHLQPPYLLFHLPGAIQAGGIMALSTTLPVSPVAPYDVPLQALIGLNPDSLTNLFVLEVR